MPASLNEVFAFLSKLAGCSQMPICLSNLRDYFQRLNCKRIITPSDRSLLLSQVKKLVIVKSNILIKFEKVIVATAGGSPGETV
jgi:hypothetical protein